MISRIWHGYATFENADQYERTVALEVIPEILDRGIKGLEKVELFRQSREDDVEFVTIIWFHDLDAVRAFVGDDYEQAHVPPKARELLSSFDEKAQHYEVLLAKSGRK